MPTLEEELSVNRARIAFPPDEAVEVMRDFGYEPQEPFPGWSAPWACVCTGCGRPRRPMLREVALWGKYCRHKGR